MKYLSSGSIRKFVEGKTIAAIDEADPQTWFLKFTDGTSLRLSCHIETCASGRRVSDDGLSGLPHREIKVFSTVIATPFTAYGRIGYS